MANRGTDPMTNSAWRRGLRRNAWRAGLLWLGGLGSLAPFGLVGCAASPSGPDPVPGKVTEQMRSGSPELRAYQVMDWIAPDDRTLVVNGVDRSLFEGRFSRGCAGLRLANSIAFIVPPGAALSGYSGVVLPDGTRCRFARFTRLSTTAPAAKAAENP